MNHSLCCAKHNRSPLHRSFGKNRCANADWTNTVPSFRSYNCGHLHRWFHFLSDRTRRSTNDNRCWYRLLPAHSGESMYGCRSPGKSTNHTSRNRGLYTHKCPNFEYNGKDSTRNIRHGLCMCATEKRMFPAKSSFCRMGRCRQYQWMHGMPPSRALS